VSTIATLDPLGNSQPPSVEAGRGSGVRRHVESRTRDLSGERCPHRGGETRFGQDENTHGRFPAAAPRCVSSVSGLGNAMRYMLTGDHWSAEES